MGNPGPADSLTGAVTEEHEKLLVLMFVQAADRKVQTLLWNDSTAWRKRVVDSLGPGRFLESRQNCFLIDRRLPESLDDDSGEAEAPASRSPSKEVRQKLPKSQTGERRSRMMPTARVCAFLPTPRQPRAGLGQDEARLASKGAVSAATKTPLGVSKRGDLFTVLSVPFRTSRRKSASSTPSFMRCGR